MKTTGKSRKSSSIHFELENKRMVLFLSLIFIVLISYIVYQVGGIFKFLALIF